MQLFSENWNPTFKVFIGKYVCVSCKREMYRDIKNNPGKTFKDEEPSTSANSNSSTDSCEIDDFSCHDKDFTCAKFEQAVKRVKMIDLLKNVSEPRLAKLRRSDFSESEKKLFLEAVDHVKRKSDRVLECVANNPWLDIVKKAIKLRRDKGFSSSCDSKPGRPMHPDIINEVQEFYLSDDISRVIPGAKDYKYVVIDGKRQQMTVIFL